MIQMQTKLEVADNSGAKSIMAVTVIGQGKKIARIGDIVKAAVESHKQFGEILVTRAGCTVSSHCGPNTLGILFLRK